jgi:hypothetical protein
VWKPYRTLAVAGLALVGSSPLLQAQPCNSTLPTLSSGSGTVVNTYYAAFMPGSGTNTAAAGAQNIRIDNGLTRGASVTLAAGDMLIVMQMQDAAINSTQAGNYGDGVAGDPAQGATAVNNSGVYEYVIAQGAIFTGGACGGGATCIPIRGAGGAPNDGLVNTYVAAPASATQGRRTFQVIRVPRYASGTLYAALTASVWSPANRNGGVLAIDVVGNLALGGATVSVDAMGYQGATTAELEGESGLSNLDYRRPHTVDAHGTKGEGIAGTPGHLLGSTTDGYPNGDRARGAPGTAGGGGSDADPSSAGGRCNSDGNDENTGGGGGANGGNGGKGGDGWNPSSGSCTVATITTGGFGGGAIPAAARTPGRLTPGGGGGAGTRNNTGPAGGGDGGGIVMIRAGTVSGTGTLRARGQTPACTNNDGGGGGGAGGSILVYAEGGVLTGLTADVSGGVGGDANRGLAGCSGTGGAHGPGGGGGGGFIYVSSAVAGASSVAGGANGQSQGNIPYGATAGSPGPTIDTTLIASEIPGVQTCTNATRATLGGLRVDPQGLVEFATSTQRRTLGFNVYATRDGRGRGTRTRLNDKPIVASLPDTSWPTLYRLETAPFRERYVVIEEIELNGRPHVMGPFAVGDVLLQEAYARLEARQYDFSARSARGEGRLLMRRPAATTRPQAAARASSRPGRGGVMDLSAGALSPGTGSPYGVKVEVRAAAGRVTVSVADLVAAGLDPAALAQPEGIRVWNFGQPVERQILPPEGGAPLSVTFVAASLATDYTERNPYIVVWGAYAPPGPAGPLTRSGPPVAAGSIRVERNTLHVPSLPPGADPWVWDFYIAGQSAPAQSFDLPTLAPTPRQVLVRVHLTGATDHAHTVSVAVNGVPVGSETFVGRALAEIKGGIPGGILQPAGNVLTVQYDSEDSTSEDWGAIFLDGFDLDIEQTFEAPVAVDSIAPYEPAARIPRDADYVLVTHGDFRAQAERIAGLKAAEGFRTLVMDVERIYDAFGSGAMEAEAVAAFLRQPTIAHRRNVLLVGDDTFDPRDFQGIGARAYVPSLVAWDGEFGRVASENRYADQDGDGQPEMTIGRLPVKTAAEADRLADKIAAQSAILAQTGGVHTFAVDNRNDANDVDFLGRATTAAGQLPPGTPTRWADVAEGINPARATLLDSLRVGAAATHYFGHGGPDVWADERLLSNADLPGLAGTDRGTVVFTWTCETQWYQYDLDVSINEGLLLVPDGGAVATVGPTGISDPYLQSQLSHRVYTYFLQGLSLGESVRRAKVEALQQGPASRPVVDGWSLLGDPSLRLPMNKASRRRR